MHTFNFEQAKDDGSAIATVSGDKTAKFLAGGTTLVDLMKLHVETPAKLVDINHLSPLAKIEKSADGGLRIGANARNTDVAYNADVMKAYPVLSQAILAGATTQIRNMATVGGNLMQRTRCPYFRDNISACNKRNPGSGCDMKEGFNRIAAVLGTSDKCVATNPGDMAVALLSLDAVVHVKGANGERQIPIADFHLLPGDTPEKETALAHGELITAVTLPAIAGETKQTYVKVRDRASYEFALASVAAVLWMNGQTIEKARISLGGVATKPWRAKEAEDLLAGKKPDSATFRAAAEAALAGAKPLEHNAFKVELAKRAIQRALVELTGVA
jgi:xanthine dehydrogenase YagS FAD-binding subunit